MGTPKIWKAIVERAQKKMHEALESLEDITSASDEDGELDEEQQDGYTNRLAYDDDED